MSKIASSLAVALAFVFVPTLSACGNDGDIVISIIQRKPTVMTVSLDYARAGRVRGCEFFVSYQNNSNAMLRSLNYRFLVGDKESDIGRTWNVPSGGGQKEGVILMEGDCDELSPKLDLRVDECVAAEKDCRKAVILRSSR